MKDRIRSIAVVIGVICLLLCFNLILFTIVLVPPKPESVQTYPSYNVGQPPVGAAVMLFWIDKDGSFHGESAMATDYAGVLPFSLDNSPVSAEPYSGWFCWSLLPASFVDLKDGF